MPGSMAVRCAPTATHPTPVRARAGRRVMPRAAPCGSRSSPSAARWVTVGALGQDLGFQRRALPRQAARAAAALRQLRHGERAVQDLLPRRVPRADRGHTIQYMVAVPLIFGRLTAADYEDAVAADPRIDALRARMEVRENPAFTREYYDPSKRYIGNAVQVFFRDGSASPRVQVDYPIGHRKRRAEGMPVLVKKFETSVDAHFGAKQAERIKALFATPKSIDVLPVNELVAALVTNGSGA